MFIGLASANGVMVETNSNPYDRETFKQVTTHQALDLLRRAIEGLGRAARLSAKQSGGAA